VADDGGKGKRMTPTYAGHNKRQPKAGGPRPTAAESTRTNKSAITKRRKFVPVTLAKVGAKREEG
jgi:hypothetical protein